MTRRCKPGQRARIISGRDTGQIVVVVRPYFGEQVARGTWPVPIYPWVVASLSGLLGSVNLDTGKENPPDRMAVYDDCDLEPLDDNDDGFDEPRWPLQIPPPVATPNSPRQEARIMTARG
jgi:hypothetical protein